MMAGHRRRTEGRAVVWPRRSSSARLAAAVLSAAVLVGCSSEEKFCTLGLSFPDVKVDVTALPSARQVCVAEDACVPVRDGTAELASPLITNETQDVRLSVRDDEATVLADAEVRLPRYYGNGFGCDGDAPQGTVTFGADGDVGVSEDTEGSDEGGGR